MQGMHMCAYERTYRCIRGHAKHTNHVKPRPSSRTSSMQPALQPGAHPFLGTYALFPRKNVWAFAGLFFPG